MEYLKELYRSPSVKLNDSKLIRSLEHGKPAPFLYVLTIAAHENDLIDLYPAAIFRQMPPMFEDLLVVGFSRGREDGLELIRTITEEVLARTGSVDLRKDLLSRERRKRV